MIIFKKLSNDLSKREAKVVIVNYIDAVALGVKEHVSVAVETVHQVVVVLEYLIEGVVAARLVYAEHSRYRAHDYLIDLVPG